MQLRFLLNGIFKSAPGFAIVSLFVIDLKSKSHYDFTMILLLFHSGVDVYERLVQKGKKPGFFQLLATQTVSAVWHVSI